MKLSAVEQRESARKAQWYIDVTLGKWTGDSVVFTGDGVDDLDRVISLVAAGTLPGFRMQLDAVQADARSGQYPAYRDIDLEDLVAIRAWYVTFYGNVDKPEYWNTSGAEQKAFQQS